MFLPVPDAVFDVLTDDSLVHSNVCFTGDKPFSFVVQAFDDMARLKQPHDLLFMFRFHLIFQAQQKSWDGQNLNFSKTLLYSHKITVQDYRVFVQMFHSIQRHIRLRHTCNKKNQGVIYNLQISV